MATPTCKVCGYATDKLCTVDLNYAVSAHERFPLGRSDEQVSYYECQECRFVFTDAFENWLPSDFSSKIYNDDYIIVDPEYAGKRPRAISIWTSELLRDIDRSTRILDYGGGTGILSEELRKEGFQNAISWDPFIDQNPAAGKFSLITSYEVFEHHRDPDFLFQQIGELLSDDGAILVSTKLVPEDIREQRENWWYIGPRNGHLSLYSREAMRIMCARNGLRCWTNGDDFHVIAKSIQRPSNNKFLSALAVRLSWVNNHGAEKADFDALLKGTYPKDRLQTLRYRSLETFERYLPFFASDSVLVELGDYSPVAFYLRRFATVSSYSRDFRGNLALPDASCDAVLLLSAAERIKDYDVPPADTDRPTLFESSGLDHLFRESFRILKPNGNLIVTMSNVCSVTSIARIVCNEHPYEDVSHVREYAPRDVQATAERIGFSVTAFSTFFSFMPLPGVDRERISDAIVALGGNPADRGDTMFFVFRKPADLQQI